MRKYSLQTVEQVKLSEEDTLLTNIIKCDGADAHTDKTIQVLQEGLLTKIPFCPFARLGADAGMKLTRAAFAVMLKFSDQAQVLLNLMTQIDAEADAKTIAK